MVSALNHLTPRNMFTFVSWLWDVCLVREVNCIELCERFNNIFVVRWCRFYTITGREELLGRIEE